MTEPRIQYAKTKDSVSIAYWTMGEGNPLVHLSGVPISHIEAELQFPEFRAWHERMARKRMLVRFDVRGAGLSDREVTEISLDAYLRDLEAVVDHLDLQSFALFAPGPAGPIAIAYAARHPERVSHLVLWSSSARLSVAMRAPRIRGLMGLLETDWELFTETTAHTIQGWSAGEPARRIAAMFRESITQDVMRAAFRALEDFDVADLLPQVQSPTLVLHRRDYTIMDVGNARFLSAGIPNAQLTILDGSAFAWYLQDWESVADAIDEFLGEGEEASAIPSPTGLVTILFTDVEGSTALTDRLGDAKARDLLREHESVVREALKAHGGSEVKTMGDGFMASFSSATKTLECAIAMQQAFAERNESAAEPIRVRIGLNAGEPIAEDDPGGRSDLFGTAVNMAARIAAQADAGEILASNVVRELVAGKDFLFADRGDTELRGFEDPVRVYEVRWREDE